MPKRLLSVEEQRYLVGQNIVHGHDRVLVTDDFMTKFTHLDPPSCGGQDHLPVPGEGCQPGHQPTAVTHYHLHHLPVHGEEEAQ